jgi:uncharacterized membrane protein
MKKIREGMKSATLKGLFTLLPILLLYLLLAEIFQLLVALATPLADLIFPPDLLENIKEEVLLAIVILFAASLLVGLLANSIIGKKWGASIERNTVGRIPMYRAVKRLTSGFTDAGGEEAFLPGLLNSAEGEQDLVFVIEDHGNGKLTIMLPWAPAAFAGSLKVVDADKVELVDSNIGEYSKILSHWGVGLPKLLTKD